MKSVFRVAALLGAAWLSTGATPNWLATTAVTAEGHRLGNPDAKVKLVAYESYTCPHCNHFEKEAAGAMRLGYIQTGKMSLEIRHYVRDPVDLTAAMLTECVAPAKFFDAHRTFYVNYDKWIQTMRGATQAQSGRWYQKDGAAARRAILADFGFAQLMAAHGLTAPKATACVNNEALAKKISDQRAGVDKTYPSFPGTPTFLLNGVMLAATAEWDMLRLQIDARL